MKDYLKAAWQFLLLFVSNIALVTLGFIVVAVAIPFRVKDYSLSDGREIVNLPKWAWLWGNDYDGLLGDKRGWWADNTPFGIDVNSYAAMWWWAAVRNPANNKRLTYWYSAPVIGSTITYEGNYVLEDKPGMGGVQFVKTFSNEGRTYYGFYLVKELSVTRAFVIRFGYKVKPEHSGQDEPPKGFTIKINPYKSI